MLFVALPAACGGYTGAVGTAIYWKQNRAELSASDSDFPDEDISHDTINRLFRIIKPGQFRAMLLSCCIFNSYGSNNGLASEADR